jgi:tetratricopeptide (TPR) repeat protein
MKHFVAIFVITFFFASLIYANRALPWTELTITPAKATETAHKYRLLPTKEEQIDTDAADLYQKAIQSLPQDYQPKQFSDWHSLPPDQLPAKEVESALEKLKPTLDLLSQAVRSKRCNWSFVKPGQVSQQFMDDLSKYRQFAFILDVQAKLQIAQGQYDQAKETLKTSLTMAKHLGDAPTLVQGMVGIALAALSQRRIEQWIQSDNAPNLYWALKDLPQPLADVKKAIKIETDNLENYNFLLRWQFKKQLKPAHDRVLVQMNYVDRKISALQCIEALRLYAGTHGGKFPEKLADVTDIKVPVDPVTKKAFSYKSTGSEAVLQMEGTEGSDGRDAVRYEIKLKE